MEALKGPDDHAVHISEPAPPPPIKKDGEQGDTSLQHCGDEWQHRRWFVAQVLAVVFIQLWFTTAVCRLSFNIGPLRDYADKHFSFWNVVICLNVGWLAYFGVSSYAILWEKPAWNFTALLIATFVIAIGLGIAHSAVKVPPPPMLHVLSTSVVTTAEVAAACFVIAWTSPIDFTNWACMPIIIAVVVVTILPKDSLGWIAAIFGVGVIYFSFGLVQSLQALLGSGPFARRRRDTLDREDWALGALYIYFGIICIYSALIPVNIWLNSDGKLGGGDH